MLFPPLPQALAMSKSMFPTSKKKKNHKLSKVAADGGSSIVSWLLPVLRGRISGAAAPREPNGGQGTVGTAKLLRKAFLQGFPLSVTYSRHILLISPLKKAYQGVC